MSNFIILIIKYENYSNKVIRTFLDWTHELQALIKLLIRLITHPIKISKIIRVNSSVTCGIHT